MRALLLDGYGVKLGASGTSLVVRSKGAERKVPVSEVDLVVVTSGGVSVSSRALRLLAAAGVELVVLGPNGEPVAMTYLSHYTRTPATRRAQYEAFMTRLGVQVAAAMVRCKVLAQANALLSLSSFAGRPAAAVVRKLEAYAAKAGQAAAGAVSVEGARRELMELEAAAAREYWGAVARLLPSELGFDGRDQDGADPVNTSLNYMYALLYAASFRELLLAGLDPYAGFLHEDRSGRPVLVYDYVEQFRAHAVDVPLLLELMRGWRPRLEGGLLDRGSRRRLVELFVKALGDGARCAYRPMTLGEALREYALRLASSLRSGLPYACYCSSQAAGEAS